MFTCHLNSKECSAVIYNLLVGCTIQRRGENFTVPHGEYFVDIDGCQRCLCSNGDATRCEPAPICIAANQQSPEACFHKGQNYRSGERFQVMNIADI